MAAQGAGGMATMSRPAGRISTLTTGAVRAFCWAMLVCLLVFLVNNYLNFWLGWPGATAPFSSGEEGVSVLAWLQPHLEPPIALPVQVYVAAISLMVITAFGARGAGASRLVVIGALLFFISDLAVAMQRIVAPGFPAYLWGLPLYYSGQLCLALGASHSSSQ